jgi:MFS transporter, NNP family, nitrate/nitrite transporter
MALLTLRPTTTPCSSSQRSASGLPAAPSSVGVAYVSRSWYPTEKQGTALGIFGAGNVGAAVTKFVAPFVMVAYGWKAVALRSGRRCSPSMGVIFFLLAKDDPQLLAERRKIERQSPLRSRSSFAPLRKLQVWRFSLYYFFVFGAFVALALWMPHYLIDVYGLDIALRRHGAAASFSLSASLFRILWRGLSDRFGARRVMYWTFGFSLGLAPSCCQLPADPDYVILAQARRTNHLLDLRWAGSASSSRPSRSASS